jgi:hypothetical protein
MSTNVASIASDLMTTTTPEHQLFVSGGATMNPTLPVVDSGVSKTECDQAEAEVCKTDSSGAGVAVLTSSDWTTTTTTTTDSPFNTLSDIKAIEAIQQQIHLAILRLEGQIACSKLVSVENSSAYNLPCKTDATSLSTVGAVPMNFVATAHKSNTQQLQIGVQNNTLSPTNHITPPKSSPRRRSFSATRYTGICQNSILSCNDRDCIFHHISLQRITESHSKQMPTTEEFNKPLTLPMLGTYESPKNSNATPTAASAEFLNFVEEELAARSQHIKTGSNLQHKLNPNAFEFLPAYGKFALNPNAPTFTPSKTTMNPSAAPFVPVNLRLNPLALEFVPVSA